MVAIKDMEMPNACTSTKETLGDIEVANCPLYNVCKHRDTIRTNYKPADCPLVEIVTCKDCRHCHRLIKAPNVWFCEKHNCVSKNFYCADAKRRE